MSHKKVRKGSFSLFSSLVKHHQSTSQLQISKKNDIEPSFIRDTKEKEEGGIGGTGKPMEQD